MLETGREGFGQFADYGGPEDGRLYISFGRADEALYIGLSPEYTNDGVPFENNTIASRYQFRIRQDNPDGADPIVHGPFTVTNLNANVSNYAEAEFGVYDTTRLIGGEQMYVFRPGAAGDYYIEFDDVSADGDRRVNIPFWDLTVVREEQEVIGRVWSRGWAFRTPQVTGDTPPDCVWDREFNGSLFSYTEDGFVSMIDFQDSGFQGLSFNIAFNSTGPGTSGDLGEDRKSVPGVNQTGNARQHRIFLSLPDIELFPDGICGEVTAGDSFNCGGSAPYCLQVDVTRSGQVEILLDFNGNGILDDNSQDVNLVYDFAPDSLSACIPWNGLRGDSTPVDFTDTVDVIITYSQGVQHWSAYDVEFMKNGFCVETVRPTCDQTISSNFLYYDDRDILEDPGTGAVRDNREGCACDDSNCRTWDNFSLNPGGNCDTFNDNETTGYGDKSTLNTWWFANSRSIFKARVPVINASIIGPDNICEGETAVLVARDGGVVGVPTYLWEGPESDGASTDTIRVTTAGEYCLTVIDPTGCNFKTCTTLTVTDFDNVTLPGELEICFGESVQLPEAGNPLYSYTWSPALGIDDINSNQPTFNPTETTIYTVLITNANSNGVVCETSDQVIVNVLPDLDLQVIGGGPICDPTTSFTATTTVDAEVTLFDAAGNQIGTGNNYTVDVSGETDYLMVAVTDAGCRDSVNFTVSGGPVDIAVADTVLTCLSDGVALNVTNLDANDNLTYSWAPALLFDPATVNSATPTFTGNPGDYAVTVTVTNQYNCVAEEEIDVILIDDGGALSFDAAVDCDGLTFDFTNTSSVDFGFVYDFGDGQSSNDTSPQHVYDMPGTYTVTLSLIYDQVCVASFTREVTAFETVLEAGFSVNLGDCDNGTTTLDFNDTSLNATGSALSYNWTFTGASPTSSDLANPTVTVSESGTVTATLSVSSADNCSSEVDTSITIDLAEINLAEEIIICPGDSTALNIGADETLSYNWSPSPDFDPTAANPTTSEAGTYIVTVTSNSANFNCVNVDTVTVVIADSIQLVISGPNGPLNGSDGEPGQIIFPTLTTCGSGVDLSADIMTNDDVTITYTDLEGNVIGTGNSISLDPVIRDTVVVTAENEFGCIERDTVVLINNQVDASIDVSAEGLSFCAATDTIIRAFNNDPADTLTYAWGANPIITGPLTNDFVNITTPAEGSVDIQLTVTNQFGCDTMLTVTVSSVPFTPNSYEDIVQPCFKEQFTINGGTAIEGYTYEWVPSDNLDLSDPANPIGTFEEDGDLMVTITDTITGCSETQTISVDVAPEISFMVMPPDSTLCAPGNVTFNGSSVNENAEIVWYSDPALTDQIGSGASYTVEASETGQTYTVYGEATDPTTGCSQVLPVTVIVSELTAGLPLDAVATCANETPSIFSAEGPSGNLSYVYEPADVIDDSNPLNPIFVGSASTVVTVTATDPATGCSVEVDINITVEDFSGLVGIANPPDIFLGDESELSVEGCDDCTYEWFPPNGTVTPNTGSTVVAVPDEAGVFTYEVEVTRNGCMEIILIELRVEDPLCDVDHIYVPNAFTPNGDNKNDVMRVRSAFANQITEFRFIIHNRWGQEVYSSNDIFESWDGTIEGDDLEPDVYGYWLRVICPAGQELIQKGNITILR